MILLETDEKYLFCRLIAEIDRVTGVSDSEIQEQLGVTMAVTRTVIDYGQKNENPVVGLNRINKNI